MTHLIWTAICGALLMSLLTPAFADAQDGTKPAQAAIESWLKLIDSESYEASWDAAASLFKTTLTREQWSAAVRGARAPLGKLKSRTLKSATSKSSPPGAPAGEYVLFQFDSSFEKNPTAVELVTAVQEKDGSWRVAGYSIK